MISEPINRTNSPAIQGVSPDVADQITEAIVATIKQTPSGVVELKALMESVEEKNYVSETHQPGMGDHQGKDIFGIKRNHKAHV